MICFAGLWCCIYLSAPVSYVGVTHANLLKELGNSDTVANLPHAVYQWMTAFPVLIAWFFPQPGLLKPLIMVSLSVKAVATGLVAFSIWVEWPVTVVTGSVILFAAMFGAANGLMISTLWEVVRRSVSTNRRGSTLALTYGIGPLLACIGSLVQQWLLSPELLVSNTTRLTFPMNYLALFTAAIPVMLLSVFLGSLFVVPATGKDDETGSRWSEIKSGIHEFFTYRPLILAAIGYLLVYSGGNAIFDTVSLHTKSVLGAQAQDTVGLQNFLRFGFKAITGVLLGWLLARTNPKATLLTTTGILLFALGWVLNSSGWWYLISAGLLGSGELFGAYFPNYIATASTKAHVRSNIAYLSLLGSLVGFASYFFGLISDRYGRIATFQTATGILILAMILIAFGLPARPVPRDGA